jgi:thiol-disulfide isomerase/thioredoxin
MKINIILLLIIGSLHYLRKGPETEFKQKMSTVDSLPDLNLKNVKGESFHLSSLKGKYVLLDFWASWCMPCIASMPRVDSLYSKYSGKNFAVVSISIDKSTAAWLKEQAKHHIPWINTITVDTKAIQFFNVKAVPYTVLINPNGEVILTEEGLSTESSIEKKLQEIFRNTVK